MRSKCFFFFALLVGALLIPELSTAQNLSHRFLPPASSAWSKYGADLGNTHQGVGKGATGVFGWTHESQGGISTPIVFDGNGTGYYGTSGGQVVAITTTGKVKWTFQTGGYIYSPPTVGPRGDVYVISTDYKLYSISPGGLKNWSEGILYQGHVEVGADGTIYAGETSTFKAINPDGSIRWSRRGYSTISTPVVGPDGSIYFLGYYNDGPSNLFGLYSNGQTKFSAPLPAASYPDYDLGLNSSGDLCFSVYNISGPRTLLAYSASGKPLWHQSLSNYGTVSNAETAPDGTTYLLVGNLLYGINSDGQVRFVNRLSGSEYSAFPIALGTDSSVFLTVSGGIACYASNGRLKQTIPLGLPYNEPQNLSTDGNGQFYSSNASTNVLSAFAANGRSLWNYATGGIFGAPSLAADGTVYSFSNDFYLNAFNSLGGTKWRLYLGQGSGRSAGAYTPNGTPAVASDGTIYIQCESGLYSMTSGGLINWQVTPSLGVDAPLSTIIGSDGTIYAASNGGLTALDSSGTTKWTYGATINCTPAIGGSGNDIFLGTYQGSVIALNPSTEMPVWTSTLSGNPINAICIAPGGPVIVAEGYFDEAIYALDPTTGSTLWSFTYYVHGNPAVNASGTIFVPDSGEGVFAIDSTGSQLWHTTGVGTAGGDVTIGADGTLYVGTIDGHVYALNPSTGKIEWSYIVDGPAGTPVIGADGTLYVAGLDGRLYAIH